MKRSPQGPYLSPLHWGPAVVCKLTPGNPHSKQQTGLPASLMASVTIQATHKQPCSSCAISPSSAPKRNLSEPIVHARKVPSISNIPGPAPNSELLSPGWSPYWVCSPLALTLGQHMAYRWGQPTHDHLGHSISIKHGFCACILLPLTCPGSRRLEQREGNCHLHSFQDLPPKGSRHHGEKTTPVAAADSSKMENGEDSESREDGPWTWSQRRLSTRHPS